MTCEQAAVALGVSRTLIYKLVSLRAPRIRHMRYGGKITITAEALEEYRLSCEVAPMEPWQVEADTPAPPPRVRRVRGLVIPDILGQLARDREARRREREAKKRAAKAQRESRPARRLRTVSVEPTAKEV